MTIALFKGYRCVRIINSLFLAHMTRKIINNFLRQVSGLVENLNTGIPSDTINLINVKLWMMIFIELYPFKPFSVTLTIVQGHSNTGKF